MRITQKCDKKLFFPANGIDLVHISLGYGLLQVFSLSSVYLLHFQELVAPGRQLHMQGDLKYHRNQKSKGETRHIFLFSDMMLLTISKACARGNDCLRVCWHDLMAIMYRERSDGSTSSLFH